MQIESWPQTLLKTPHWLPVGLSVMSHILQLVCKAWTGFHLPSLSVLLTAAFFFFPKDSFIISKYSFGPYYFLPTSDSLQLGVKGLRPFMNCTAKADLCLGYREGELGQQLIKEQICLVPQRP